MRQLLLFLSITITVFAVDAPPQWGQFQFGFVNNDRVEWDVPMRDAIEMGEEYTLDRRYIYIDDTLNFASYWTGAKNWSKNQFYMDHNVRPAVVIYMVQRGGDSWSAVKAGMASKEFMEGYFRHIAILADSTKGQKPIYILEPDVWTYMLQDAREGDPDRYSTTIDDWSKIKDNNFDEFCHINDLGFPWLEEFENKASNLPGAIIKTLKMRDPESYAGILVGFWGFQPSTSQIAGLFANESDVIAIGARETAKFTQALLNSTPYKGDFAGLEKNGGDLGYWIQKNDQPYITAFDWDDRKNGDWVKFAKTISDSTGLPMIGWQIAIGHPGLPNIENQYEDNFFPYFFTHTQDYIDAGFIGMMAGTANQGKGTMATPPNGKLYVHPDNYPEGTRGDDGWFYSQLATFNQNRPYLPNQPTYYTVIAEVVPDTIFTPGEVTDPDWDPNNLYDNDEHGKTYHYDGNQYEFYGWYATKGTPPDQEPSQWKDLGPYGTLEITVGGTVDNSTIYFEAGSDVHKVFSPQPINGYGIDSIWVNGVAIENSSSYTTAALSENILIKVRFTPGGDPVTIQHKPQQMHTSLITTHRLHLTAQKDIALTLYNVQGQQITQQNLKQGATFSLVGLSRGVYIAQVKYGSVIQSIRITVGH